MDELDLRLLRAMGIGSTSSPLTPLPSPDRLRPSALARATGTPLQTVKDHLRRLREEGVLLGKIAFPNPRLLGGGLDVALARFEEREKPKALAALREAPWVAGYLDFVGPWVSVQLPWHSPADLEARLSRLRAEMGASSVELVDRPTVPLPARALTPLERRLVVEIIKTPDASTSDLGAATGVTERTARARVARLQREGFLVVFPYFDRAAVAGFVLPHVLVWAREGREPEAAREAWEALGARGLTPAAPARGRGRPFDLMAWTRSLLEVDALRREILACPSVKDCVALLPQDGQDRLDEVVALVEAGGGSEMDGDVVRGANSRNSR